jgi:hypothetical protein
LKVADIFVNSVIFPFRISGSGFGTIFHYFWIIISTFLFMFGIFSVDYLIIQFSPISISLLALKELSNTHSSQRIPLVYPQTSL